MTSQAQAGNPVRRLYVLTATLFLSYLCVGMSLPAVPVHVVQGLAYSNALGGLAVGVAFLSTILTRQYSGRLSDQIGGKAAMARGLGFYAVAGLICALSGWPGLDARASYAVLIVGRLVLGLGESLALVGMIGWSLGFMGQPRAGRVISLAGMGLYGAFAVGGPIGVAILDRGGFVGLMLVCAGLPLVGLLLIWGQPGVAPHAGAREGFWGILRRIWREGGTVALQGVGFAVVGAFSSLHFLAEGWPYAGLGLTSLGTGFVLSRVLFGHLPDRIGGTPVAIASLVVEAAGQYLMWLAPGPGLALAGAFLTGLGCSMVFPSMGSEVVKRVPPHLRGMAVGGFAAFQDLAYGLSGPVVGLLADRVGYADVFLVGGLAASLGLVLAVLAHRQALPSRAPTP